ncbi:hypothetical protein FACS1894186_4020 [Alphaproteobacteria bacterium]|nr:hypothetical protein FACS1894186_4020 [Alphaproteobacteria bacterium]
MKKPENHSETAVVTDQIVPFTVFGYKIFDLYHHQVKLERFSCGAVEATKKLAARDNLVAFRFVHPNDSSAQAHNKYDYFNIVGDKVPSSITRSGALDDLGRSARRLVKSIFSERPESVHRLAVSAHPPRLVELHPGDSVGHFNEYGMWETDYVQMPTDEELSGAHKQTEDDFSGRIYSGLYAEMTEKLAGPSANLAGKNYSVNRLRENLRYIMCVCMMQREAQHDQTSWQPMTAKSDPKAKFDPSRTFENWYAMARNMAMKD